MSTKFTKILYISSDENPDFANVTFEQSDWTVLDIVSKINESESGSFTYDEGEGTFDAVIIETTGHISKESFDVLYELLNDDYDAKKAEGFYWVGCEGE